MKKYYPEYLYWIVPVIIFALIFEFFLPLNKVLPGPSLILESLSPLFTVYDFLFNLFYTASGIYVSMLAAYFIIYFSAGKSIRLLHTYQHVFKALSAFRYFPLAGVLVIFIYWFPSSNIAEYIFSISFSILFLYRILFLNMRTVREEYLDSAVSIGMPPSELYSTIYWKSLQPILFTGFISLHKNLWFVMVIFEIIKGDLGIGSIYKDALEFKDISVIFTLSIIIMLVLFTGNIVLKFLRTRLIYWEN